MIKKRPRYPAGHSVAGLSPIAKALHTEEQLELYSLGFDGPQETMLFIANSPDSWESCKSFEEWWAVQPPHVLKLREMLNPLEAKDSCCAVLLVEGRNLASESFSDAEETRLRQLLGALLDLVDHGLKIGMFPDLDPSLMWMANDGATLCALRSVPVSALSAIEQVRSVGRAFYSIAGGIDAGKQQGTLAPLSRWAKFAGDELSSVITRCLAPSGSKSQITSLSGLSSTLKRERESASIEKGSVGAEPKRSDGEATGLGKVAGMHALKELLYREVVAPIRNPEPHKRYGLSIPNGILLYGPPGCGKTYIARQLAEELGQYFVEIIPSELASPYIHGSVTHIRDLFDSAAENAPAIIFIDEFEALVPARGELGGFQQHKAEEVNEFLAHLNGCAEKGIFVIAATNEPKKIDPAVRRTGRLDKMIYVGPPDAEARKEMLKLHLEKRPLAKGVVLDDLASTLSGYSASDIRFLVDEAARKALKEGTDITLESFFFAASRIPPSVTAETEAKHQSIEQRGV